MEKRVRTAVIGYGMISNIYMKNLKSLFRIIDLVAVGGRNVRAARAQADVFGVERAASIDDIAGMEDIELAVVLTPASAHYDVIRKMLLAGKHVWTEKTMAVAVEQGRELVHLAEEKGLLLGVAPDTVLGAGLQTARRALDTDMIGKVTSGLAVINRNQSLNAELFTFLRGEGGSLPYDVGIYYIAALLSLLGPVESVCSFGVPAKEHEPEFLYCNADAEPWLIPGLNVVSASLRFVSGAVVSVLFDGNTVNAGEHALTLFGTRGVLKLGDPNTFDGSVTLRYAGQDDCVLPFTHGYDGANTLEPAPFDGYGHRGIGAAELAWAIRHGRPNRCSKEYGLHCLEILAGMEESAATGNSVEIASRFEMKPLRPGYYSGFGGMRGDAERSLAD